PNELEFAGTDGLKIQGWYFRPKDFDPQKNYPAVVEIHGGPQIMWGNSFWHEFQVLCSRGYFVFFCNPRGSAGYGARFQKLRGKGGYTDMADIMKGLDAFLAKEGSVDQSKLCVTGGSYGGFLTAWIVTHTDRFAAAVAQRGVYDELNMFGSGDIPESVEWYYGGIPREENLKELWEYSPIAHARNVTTPLLILHSELDYRCPISQAESFFAYLRRNGNRDVNMVRFPREGHSLSRSGEPWHRIERLRRITGWFDHQIKYTGLIDEVLSDDQLDQWVFTLKTWRRENLKLSRSIECGNNDIANMMVQKIWKYLKLYKQQCNLTVEGHRLCIELKGIDCGEITMKEVLLADRLNKIFPA
ncbi:MAG TPA: S9 family peptidase, partial [Flexilinea sp.]|nr:S9 family peptidase [Flexilinea sp.]